jgi:hypothetical protein
MISPSTRLSVLILYHVINRGHVHSSMSGIAGSRRMSHLDLYPRYRLYMWL